MEKYDVVVIGAGPAGSTAAKYAAEKGADVLLIEKRQEIGSPIRCAEGVGKEDFEALNLPEKYISNRVLGAKLISPKGTVVSLDKDEETGYILDRKLFDRELALEAVRAGAHLSLKTNCRSLIREDGRIKGIGVKEFGSEKEIGAKVIIAADGRESNIARYMGSKTTLRSNDLETCFEYLMGGVDIDTNYTYFYIGNCYSPGGYIWIFPKGKDLANIGIGVLGSYCKGKGKGYPKYLLDKFISKHIEYKGEALELIAGTVPVSEPLDSTAIENLLIVGDAARVTDELTGGGIINGVITGKIAGETAGRAVDKNDLNILNEYEERWRSKIGHNLNRSYKFKEKFVKFSDETFEDIADSIKDFDFESLSTSAIIKAIAKKHPKLLLDVIKDIV